MTPPRARREPAAVAPAPAPLFDTHAHLTDAQFAADLPAVLARARAADVTEVLLPASEPADASRAAAIAKLASTSQGAAPRVFWSAGLHPHDARRWSAELAADILAALENGAHAVGETGLDFHYENSPRADQARAFAGQAQIALTRDLTLIVHSRAADVETAEILEESGILPERVILHCFSAGADLFGAALERGYYVSFSGLITFPKFPTPEFLARVPTERILIETDAPYLAPVPLRGRRNEPAFLPATLARLAQARGLDAREAAFFTRANALRAYRLLKSTGTGAVA